MGSVGEMKSQALLCLWLACVGLALAAPEQAKNAKPQANAQAPPTGNAGRKPLSTGGSASRRLLAVAVTSITPTYGPMEGNSLVMVVGTDFDTIGASDTKECKFGTSKTTATVINATHISCRTPKHSTGAATFELMAPTAIAATATFTFFPTMFVSDFKTSSVLRYDADTGAFFDVFVQPRSGGLDGPWGLAFGLDHNFYVASERTSSVLVYDGSTGSPRGVYIEGGGLDHPWGLIFDKFTNDTY